MILLSITAWEITQHFMAHQKLKHLEKPFITSQIPISLTITRLGMTQHANFTALHFPGQVVRDSNTRQKIPGFHCAHSTVQLKILEILDKKCVEPNLGPTHWNKKQDPSNNTSHRNIWHIYALSGPYCSFKASQGTIITLILSPFTLIVKLLRL